MQWNYCSYFNQASKQFPLFDVTKYIYYYLRISYADYLKSCLCHQGHDLIVGNLGDSRAVLGTRDQNDKLVAHQLTVDLKPDHPSNLFHS